MHGNHLVDQEEGGRIALMYIIGMQVAGI